MLDNTKSNAHIVKQYICNSSIDKIIVKVYHQNLLEFINQNVAIPFKQVHCINWNLPLNLRYSNQNRYFNYTFYLYCNIMLFPRSQTAIETITLFEETLLTYIPFIKLLYCVRQTMLNLQTLTFNNMKYSNSSYSEIPESIHNVSRTANQLKQSDFPPNRNQNKSKPKAERQNMKNSPSLPNDPSRQFMQYYEENMRLKAQHQMMLKQITQMKSKLNTQTKINRTLNQSQLRIATKQEAWPKKQLTQKSYIGSKKFSSMNKNGNVQHLLEIIDHYKQKLLTAEQEITNLKRQKTLLQKDAQLKDRRSHEVVQNYASNSKADESLHQKVRTSIRQLELQKQKSKFQQAEIKRLQSKIRTLDIKGDDYSNLKIQNRSLEQKLMRMTNLPGFGEVVKQGDSQNKVKQLQEKLKLGSQKYTTIKNSNIKLQAQVKLLKTKLVQSNIQCDNLEKQNKQLREQSIDNPIIQRLMKNPQLLLDVVGQIDRKDPKKESRLTNAQSYEKILMEKEELAKELISTKHKIAALQEAWKQKQRIFKQEKKQLAISMQNQPKADRERLTANKFGVHYDEDVSMFTEEKTNASADANYFDLYIGQLHLLETMVKTVGNVHNSSSPLILATVDFYNHNTMHSKLTQGCHCDLQSQFSFKVNEDDFFFKYLNKGQFQIDIWVSEGNKNNYIGKVTVELKPLIIKCKPKVAPVVSTSLPIYLNQRVMGSINLVMRMRLPIYEKAQKLYDSAIEPQGQESSEHRKLAIHIEEGRGFEDRANTFVYYPFRLQDFYTKTYKGSNPLWNHFKMIDLKYNNDLKNYLRRNELQFTVFDDNAVLTEGQNSDIVGSGQINLTPLLQGNQVRQRVQIKRGRQTKGTIQVKIFWHDPQQQKGRKQKVSQQNPIQKIHEGIKKYLISHHLKAADVFRLIDDNKTGMISYNELHSWVLKIVPQTRNQDIAVYYDSFKQPVNLLNFVTRIETVQQKTKPNSDIIAQFGAINKLLNKNTFQIKKKQTIDQFLKGKDIITVSLDIDKDQNGKITKDELTKYFESQNVEMPIMVEEQVYLVEFLKRYQSYM